MLASGYPKDEAVLQAFPEKEVDDLMEAHGYEFEDDFVDAVCTHPSVLHHLKEVYENSSGTTLTTEEVRAYLRRIILTPLSEVTESSDLCQSAKTSYNPKTGATSSEIKMVDKLKALDMDNRIAGRYDDTLKLGPSNDLLDMLSQMHNTDKLNPPTYDVDTDQD